jgi:glycosyltransferase involved in cell wall biosynthesis
MPAVIHLSVAIPLHNEESVLPELLARVQRVLEGLPGSSHEIVFVDDGSTDRTFEMLCAAAQADPRIIAISLSRNFGHQAAITAALDHVSGDAVVVMDGDLQDVPLRICYFVFYRMMARLSDIHLPLDSGDFGLMSQRVVNQVRRMPEHHRYLRGMRSWVGFRQIGIPVERAARHSGKSKYSALRLMKLAADGIFAFSIVPIRAAALVGALVMFASSLYLAYALYVKIVLHQSPQGFTALLVAVTFLSGIMLFFIGIIGEYVGRIYEETKARPQYVIGKMVGRDAMSRNSDQEHGVIQHITEKEFLR